MVHASWDSTSGHSVLHKIGTTFTNMVLNVEIPVMVVDLVSCTVSESSFIECPWTASTSSVKYLIITDIMVPRSGSTVHVTSTCSFPEVTVTLVIMDDDAAGVASTGTDHPP